MHSTSSLIHSLKDQIRNVKYSIRAEAHDPGSMLPRALQSREIRRLTSLGSVVSRPAFRLVDGIVTRVETIAMDLLGTPVRGERAVPEPVDAWVADGLEFTEKTFGLLKRMIDVKGAHNAFVSEQALDAAWTAVSGALADPAAAARDPVLACAVVADALIRAKPVRQVGFSGDQTHFARSPNLYGGVLVGLLVAVATSHPDALEDGDAALESVDSAVDARFDRFAAAAAAEAPAEAIAAEYRKLVAFLP